MNRKIKFLSSAGIISPLIAILTIFASASLHDWFSWTENALSDLGALGVEYANVYNYGLILTAIVGLLFVMSAFKFLREDLSRVGILVFGIGLIFLIGVAVFPSGTSPHITVSYAFFGFSALGMFLVGLGESLDQDRLGYFTLGLILVGLLLAYFTAVSFTGAAPPEMVGVVCFSIFSISYGLRIYRAF